MSINQLLKSIEIQAENMLNNPSAAMQGARAIRLIISVYRKIKALDELEREMS
jgi:hypothetical protein